MGKASTARRQLDGTLEHVFTIRVEQPPSDMERLEDVMRPYEGAGLDRLGEIDIGPDDECSIYCTSGAPSERPAHVSDVAKGTSALPKAVLSTQRANCVGAALTLMMTDRCRAYPSQACWRSCER